MKVHKCNGDGKVDHALVKLIFRRHILASPLEWDFNSTLERGGPQISEDTAPSHGVQPTRWSKLYYSTSSDCFLWVIRVAVTCDVPNI